MNGLESGLRRERTAIGWGLLFSGRYQFDGLIEGGNFLWTQDAIIEGDVVKLTLQVGKILAAASKKKLWVLIGIRAG